MYTKIFCPVDGSETSEHGMTEAIRLAKDQRAQLCFLHVVDNSVTILYSPVVETSFEYLRECGREILASAIAAAREQGVAATGELKEIMAGRAAPVIVEEAEKYGADLIVMGTHGRRGIGRLLMGSDAATVIGSSVTPILLVK